MQRLTCFLGEGLNHVTGGSTPCTVAGPDFHKILRVGQEVLHSGRVLLAGDLDSVCSRFFVVSSPVPNLQAVKLGDVSLWFRHFRCEKPFPIGSDHPPDVGWASESQPLPNVSTLLSVLEYGKAHNTELIKHGKSKSRLASLPEIISHCPRKENNKKYSA